MTISMYQASVPVCIRMLNNLAAVLEKAAAYADARKIDPEVLINDRLYPDMLTMGRQILIASDTAKGGVARLAGVEPPKYEDNEKTFPELIERLRKTVAYLNTLKPEQIDGSEKKMITIKVRNDSLTLEGMPYQIGRAHV